MEHPMLQLSSGLLLFYQKHFLHKDLWADPDETTVLSGLTL